MHSQAPRCILIVASCLLVPYHPLRLWDVSYLPPEFRYWCHHVMWQICAYLMSVKAVLSHKSLVWFILRRIAKYGGPIPPLSWELWPRWLGIVCPRKLVHNREPEIETFISRAVDGRFASFKAHRSRIQTHTDAYGDYRPMKRRNVDVTLSSLSKIVIRC